MTEPTTPAGRAFLDDQPGYMEGRPYAKRVVLPAILAIEEQARAEGRREAVRLDVERLAEALYEQTRATYHDPRRAPPPWDVITTRSRNTEWKPQGGSHVEHYGSLADSYRHSARSLISFYNRVARHGRSSDPEPAPAPGIDPADLACPMCGRPVRVVGDTTEGTMHYEPVDLGPGGSHDRSS